MVLKDFEFAEGVQMDVNMHVTTLGTPRRNAAGEIEKRTVRSFRPGGIILLVAEARVRAPARLRAAERRRRARICGVRMSLFREVAGAEDLLEEDLPEAQAGCQWSGRLCPRRTVVSRGTAHGAVQGSGQ